MGKKGTPHRKWAKAQHKLHPSHGYQQLSGDLFDNTG